MAWLVSFVLLAILFVDIVHTVGIKSEELEKLLNDFFSEQENLVRGICDRVIEFESQNLNFKNERCEFFDQCGHVDVLKRKLEKQGGSWECKQGLEGNDSYCGCIGSSFITTSNPTARFVNRGDEKVFPEFVCLSESLKSYFKENRERGRKGWQYFSSVNGGYTQYPGSTMVYQEFEEVYIPDMEKVSCLVGSDECVHYDPRLQPWYINAASGLKTVILLIDVSGSMRMGERMEKIREAAGLVIDGLSDTDMVMVIGVGESIQTCTPTIESATMHTKNYLKNICLENEIRAYGKLTQLPRGIELAISSILEAQKSESTSFCRNAVILFFTDGQLSRDQMSQTRKKFMKEAGDGDVRAAVFTFSLAAKEESMHFMKDLACDHNGIFFPINDEGELPTTMSSYFKYMIQTSQEFKDEGIMWTPLYNDRLGTGKMTTVAKACFQEKGIQDVEFLGVAGYDISLGEIRKIVEDYVYDNKKILRRFRNSKEKIAREIDDFVNKWIFGKVLIDRSKYCTPLFISETKMEELRGDQACKVPLLKKYSLGLIVFAASLFLLLVLVIVCGLICMVWWCIAKWRGITCRDSIRLLCWFSSGEGAVREELMNSISRYDSDTEESSTTTTSSSSIYGEDFTSDSSEFSDEDFKKELDKMYGEARKSEIAEKKALKQKEEFYKRYNVFMDDVMKDMEGETIETLRMKMNEYEDEDYLDL